jgi:hypothetical protein
MSAVQGAGDKKKNIFYAPDSWLHALCGFNYHAF